MLGHFPQVPSGFFPICAVALVPSFLSLSVALCQVCHLVNMLSCVVTHGSVFHPGVDFFLCQCCFILFPCLPSLILSKYVLPCCHMTVTFLSTLFFMSVSFTSFQSLKLSGVNLVDTFPSPESR